MIIPNNSWKWFVVYRNNIFQMVWYVNRKINAVCWKRNKLAVSKLQLSLLTHYQACYVPTEVEKEMADLLTAVGGLARERGWCVLGAGCRKTSHCLLSVGLWWRLPERESESLWSPRCLQLGKWLHGVETQMGLALSPCKWLSSLAPGAGSLSHCQQQEPSEGPGAVAILSPLGWIPCISRDLTFFSFFWFVSAVFFWALLISTIAQNITFKSVFHLWVDFAFFNGLEI